MKKTISIFAALAAFAAFGVTPNTEWQDVPGTDKVGEVLSAGGAVMTEADPVWNAQKSGYQPRLVSGTNIKTVNGNSLLGSGNIKIENGVDTNAVRDIVRDQLATNGIRSVDGAARPLPKYLHALNFDDSYPDDAKWYYGQPQPFGGCSAVRDGNTLSRNYDWTFDSAAEFVIGMSAGPGRFASIGVANCGTNLTEEIVTSGKPSRYYKCLPGRVVDGINENGVVAEINVVDGDPQTSGWHTNETDSALHPLAAVRWALDHATNAEHAATYIAANIRFPAGWTQNFHYMIADETSTYIVENGNCYQAGLYDLVKPVLTNFRVVGMQEGSGIERYNLLLGGANITNVWYTRAYARGTNPPWLSEFGNNYEYLNAALNRWNDGRTKEQHRGESYTQTTYPYETITWWQSVHTSIYDITNRTLRICVQEQDDWYTFQVPVSGGLKAETDPVWSAEKSGYQPKISDLAEIRAGAAAGATALQNESDPTVGLTNGTIHIKGASITPITEHQSLADYFTKAESSTNATAKANAAIASSPIIANKADKSDIPDVSGFVPYTGATSDLDLGLRKLSARTVESVSAMTAIGGYIVKDSRRNTVGSFEGDGFFVGQNHSVVLPYGRVWGSSSSNDLALVSQIEDATNGLAQTIPQKINAAVSANLNTYIDGETGVEYVGKFYGGSLYYVPTGNVYPPNN